MTSSKKVIFGVESGSKDELPFLADLIEAGRLRPVIDRRFSLEEIVEANRYAETEQKKGNIVIEVVPETG